MNLISEDYLMHYGVKGMKWGVRHDPQPLGKRISNRTINRIEKRRSQKMAETERYKNTKYGKYVRDVSNRNYDRATSVAKKAGNGLTAKQKKIIKNVAIGAAVVGGVGLATYGGYKLSSTRNYNKIAVAKILERHQDIKASSVNRSPYTIKNVSKNISGGTDRLNITTNAKVKNTVLGPQLKGSRSTVSKIGEGTLRGARTEKTLETFSAGRDGRNNPIAMTKKERKRLLRLYNTQYKYQLK